MNPSNYKETDEELWEVGGGSSGMMNNKDWKVIAEKETTRRE
jgi:hypothetical protein